MKKVFIALCVGFLFLTAGCELFTDYKRNIDFTVNYVISGFKSAGVNFTANNKNNEYLRVDYKLHMLYSGRENLSVQKTIDLLPKSIITKDVAVIFPGVATADNAAIEILDAYKP